MNEAPVHTAQLWGGLPERIVSVAGALLRVSDDLVLRAGRRNSGATTNVGPTLLPCYIDW
jgi:hypothetical protein